MGPSVLTPPNTLSSASNGCSRDCPCKTAGLMKLSAVETIPAH
jgi:hypothetical protein